MSSGKTPTIMLTSLKSQLKKFTIPCTLTVVVLFWFQIPWPLWSADLTLCMRISHTELASSQKLCGTCYQWTVFYNQSVLKIGETDLWLGQRSSWLRRQMKSLDVSERWALPLPMLVSDPDWFFWRTETTRRCQPIHHRCCSLQNLGSMIQL